MGLFSRFFKRSQAQESLSDFDDEVVGDDVSDSLLDDDQIRTALDDLNVDKAIASHEQWKDRLRQALDGSSPEILDPEAVCRDDRCDLGRWLHGTGRERLGHHVAFTALVASHQSFHRQAARVIELSQSGRKQEAERELDTAYRHASNRVVLLLKAIRNALHQEG
ncbi:CZB domain-containing protein [Hydrogenophaga sp. 5NK40-0174]|uniref:CZB domain-containing protein n=1 Tax=Hydrogenophaga sp. 5NK40-0174 TaxID=3127649 RepID=UPI003102D33F